MEELPPLVVELISGPKHSRQPVLLAVSLTFDSQSTNGSWEVFHLAKVLTSLSHRPE